MKQLLILLVLLSGIQLVSAQGSLVLIGGGSEEEGNWSDQPYQWALTHSVNKRVAVVSYSSSTEWIANYFVSLGANWARTFIINNTAVADAQSTYDTLLTYDVVFLKGGDQSNYYFTYKNTKTQQALQQIFNQGGVLCGTSAGCSILSPVAYTAETVSVYPDEAILNPLNPDITLRNDFLQTWPSGDYIYDSHFVERGRFARLVGFMAKWYLNTGQRTKGVGVGDQTAICIGTDGIGHVYGSGAVTFFSSDPGAADPVYYMNNMLGTRDLKVAQLLEGCTYDFNTGQITGLTHEIPAGTIGETHPQTVYLSSSENYTELLPALDILATQPGFVGNNMLMLSGQSNFLFSQIKSYFTTAGSTQITTAYATNTYGEESALHDAIANAEVIFFNGNDWTVFQDFLTTTNGAFLLSRLHDPISLVFLGPDVLMAGKKNVYNTFDDIYNSYNGTLALADGLGAMESMVVMPKTYISSTTDYYENTISGVMYAMIQDTVKNGLWLNGNTFVRRAPGPDQKIRLEVLSGDYPAMLIQNENATLGDLASQLLPGHTLPRNVAGFENLRYNLIPKNESIEIGDYVTAVTDNKEDSILIYPNPADHVISIRCEEPFEMQLFDIQGHAILYKASLQSWDSFDISHLPAGFYIISIKGNISGNMVFRRIVKK